MKPETKVLTFILFQWLLILVLVIIGVKLDDYYEAREMGARLYCVEMKSKPKFCEKYF